MRKYDKVIHRVMILIEQGTISEGHKIPSVRAMSRQMGVSTMTVLEAYHRLEGKGVVESRPKSGYIVRPKSLRINTIEMQIRLPNALQTDIAVHTEEVKIPLLATEILEAAMQPGMIPLGSGCPDPTDLPSEELSLHLSRAARTRPLDINQYEIGRGDSGLLNELHRIMVDLGCLPLPGEIMVTAGITQGLMLALRAVTTPGDIVAVESPGYYGFYGILHFLNLKSVEIPTDPNSGIDLNELENVMGCSKPPRCLVVSPSFSNPTGALMPEDKRKRLVKLASEGDLVLIEDDTYGFLSYSDTPPRPLKTFAPNEVIYMGSFSKILAPGYRLAWVAGGRYNVDIYRCFCMGVLSLPLVTQRAIASYLKHGGMPQHLRRLRKKYHDTIRLFQHLVARYFPPGTRTTHPQGGHFLWIEMPQGYDTIALAKKALQEKITIAPGVLFSSRQHYKNHLRLNCALKCDDQVIFAIKRLGELAEQCRGLSAE